MSTSVEQYIRSERGFLLREDTSDWTKWYGDQDWYKAQIEVHLPLVSNNLVFHLDRLFLTFPEFRSLFDFRTKSEPTFSGMLPQFKRATDLYIATPVIGPRLRIQHGHGTYIFAREVGSDFWINHHVTVGAHRGTPRIGNRVTIRTGAVVVGPITIGDDALITANSVVSADMPPNSVAYAPRTVVKPRR